MKLITATTYEEMCQKAARVLAAQITLKPQSVLGLATGSTPIGIYQELVREYQEGKLNFSQVTTVNLDEYLGLSPENNQSYRYFMNQHLFNKVNIPKENTHVPNGQPQNPQEECRQYEELLAAVGPVDIQLLGIGNNGHIGFNEPCGHFPEFTHVVNLSESTIQANSRFFAHSSQVPRQAVSMGIGTIMKAKKILLVASGQGKAQIVYDMMFGPVTPQVPASLLRFHPDVTVFADQEAGALALAALSK